MASIAALALTTAPFSNAPERSFAQAAILALMTAFLGLTYLSRWIDRRRLLGDLMLVFAVSAIVQLSGIVSALIGQTWSLGLSGRLLGILGNANYVGMLSAVGVTLGLALFATVAGRRTRALTVAGIVVLCVALLWSGSRGSMVALAVGLIATLVAWRAWWFIVGFIAIVGGGAIAAVVAFPALFDRSGSLDVTSGRGELWGVILEHWASSPIIGTGYRTIEILPGTGGFSSHNIFVWLLTELGIVGLALFATVLVAIAVRGKLSGFVGVAVCVMVAELTESTLYGWGGPAAITFWLVLLAYPAYRRSDLSSATLASAGDLRRVRIRGVST